MSPRLRRLTSLALLAALGSSTATSFAQVPPPAAPPAAETPAQQAAALKAQGNEALGALRPGDALEAYRKAYALSPEPALHYNMGHALEALGNYPEALREYEEFARVAPPELKARVPRLAELIAEVRARVTVVTIQCNVPGARVLVRDVAVGEIGQDGKFSRAFPAGSATIEVVADGYAPHKQRAEFQSGGVASFDVALVTKSTAGVLRVTTTPVPGDVFVDDRGVGRSPTETVVAAGPHTIVVKSSGVKDVTTQAVVEVGDTREVNIDLEPTPPVYTRWWFWTTIGAVVAGGVVITYAALKSKPADCGTIQPCNVMPSQILTRATTVSFP